MKKAAVIGGGIFGLYCALELLKNQFQVDIYEQATQVGQGASKINQARLHLGYHYPRSKETALQCIKGFYRFQERFPQSVNNNFKQYYVIASKGSKTTAEEYLNFCRDLELPHKEVKLGRDIINENRIDLCIEVPEVAFDYKKIVDSLEEEIRSLGGRILLNHKIISGDVISKTKTLEYQNTAEGSRGSVKYDLVINATYMNINGLNQIFGLRQETLAFEMCEMSLVSLPDEYNSIGVTIMDGNFCAIMPFGISGYQTISDVRRTPHERSDCNLPRFKCNIADKSCSPSNIDNCSGCELVPSTNYYKMLGLAKQYLPYAKHLKLVKPMFMVKTILSNVEDTDARPSKIFNYLEAENYYVIFAGKIDTVLDLVGDLINLIKE
jgi:hypothetical protein